MEKIHTLQVDIKPKRGANIKQVCSEAKVLSDEIGIDFEFKFNGVDFTTENNSINDMVESYLNQR